MSIVERLRAAALLSESGGGQWFQLIHRCREAADEIERLQEALTLSGEYISCRYEHALAIVTDMRALADRYEHRLGRNAIDNDHPTNRNTT